MIHLAQPSISFLNAPGTGDLGRCETGSGEMRCLFAALNEAACAVTDPQPCLQPRHLNGAVRSCTGQSTAADCQRRVHKLNEVQSCSRTTTSAKTSLSPFSTPTSAALPAGSSSEATALRAPPTRQGARRCL